MKKCVVLSILFIIWLFFLIVVPYVIFYEIAKIYSFNNCKYFSDGYIVICENIAYEKQYVEVCFIDNEHSERTFSQAFRSKLLYYKKGDAVKVRYSETYACIEHESLNPNKNIPFLFLGGIVWLPLFRAFLYLLRKLSSLLYHFAIRLFNRNI